MIFIFQPAEQFPKLKTVRMSSEPGWRPALAEAFRKRSSGFEQFFGYLLILLGVIMGLWQCLPQMISAATSVEQAAEAPQSASAAKAADEQTQTLPTAMAMVPYTRGGDLTVARNNLQMGAYVPNETTPALDRMPNRTSGKRSP